MEERSVFLPDTCDVKTLMEFQKLAEKDSILAKLEANGLNVSRPVREIERTARPKGWVGRRTVRATGRPDK